MKSLDFEQPLEELQQKIQELEELSKNSDTDLSIEIEQIKKRTLILKKEIFDNLSPQQILQIARHPKRPDTRSLTSLIFTTTIELHGDRLYRDDPSIVGGIGTLNNHRIVYIGHQKGHTTKEKIKNNFGMPHPEGYRKALRLMKLGEKFNMPIITFIDTPGAYPGKEAEERGQAEAIARNLREMSGLTVPIITIVIGEGGSGGALGIAVSNKIYMLEYAVYSVISPEGCASILFRDANKANYAAKNLKITAQDILDLKIADDILKEPLGGAHQNWDATAKTIKDTILKDLDNYKSIDADKITEERYNKFRSFGKFLETIPSDTKVVSKKPQK